MACVPVVSSTSTCAEIAFCRHASTCPSVSLAIPRSTTCAPACWQAATSMALLASRICPASNFTVVGSTTSSPVDSTATEGVLWTCTDQMHNRSVPAGVTDVECCQPLHVKAELPIYAMRLLQREVHGYLNISSPTCSCFSKAWVLEHIKSIMQLLQKGSISLPGSSCLTHPAYALH